MTRLDTANTLILGIEALRPGGLIPVSKAAVDDAGTVNAALDQQRLGNALTCVVIYLTVIELIVKHLWEQEHGRTAAYRHIAHTLFGELPDDTRREIEVLYNECCRMYQDAIETGQEQHGAAVVAVDMASLEEALQWNDRAMVNFKYELMPGDKSAPTGVIWSRDKFWVLPGTFPNFAVELTRWTACRSNTAAPSTSIVE